MLKQAFLLATFLGLLTGMASARTLNLPDEKHPMAMVTIPASWRPAETKKGTEATSMDNSTFVRVTAVPVKDKDKEIKEAVQVLKQRKVDFNENKKTDDNAFKIGGLDAQEAYFEGVDQEGEAATSLTTVKVKDQVAVLIFWVSADHYKEHQGEFLAIMNSGVAAGK